tara:strand:+ start:895 stop:1116 length:222 start_codon:yes stop_codon:yes gene_type:complete
MNEMRLYRKDLASEFNISQRTLDKNLLNLQKNFPDNESLFRYIGNKQYFVKKDIDEILNLFSTLKKNSLKSND